MLNKEIECYQQVVKMLMTFYKEILPYLQVEYQMVLDEEKRNKLLNVDFYHQFFMVPKTGNNIITYCKDRNIFEISLLDARQKYEKLLQQVYYPSFIKQVLTKYSNMQVNTFSAQEVGIIVDKRKITMDDMIKGEFLYELFSSIIDLRVASKIEYRDDYGNYSKRRGSYFTEDIIEYLVRDFAVKYDIHYIPNIRHQKMVNIIRLMASHKNFKYEVINGNLSTISHMFHALSISFKISQMEREYFEEEFKIKKGSIELEELEILSKKDSITLRKELSKSLSDAKKLIQNKDITDQEKHQLLLKLFSKENSFGFANLLQFTCYLIVIFIASYILFLYLKVR